MPFTPFHLGPASVLALALLRYAYLPALLLGSIAPDIQPFLVMFFNLSGALHGPPLHTFIGSTLLLALPLTALLFILQKPIQTITTPLELNQNATVTSTLTGALIGVYSHILLDATLYQDIQPFYPINQNPLLSQNPNRYYLMYTACAISFIIALAMYAFYLCRKHSTQEVVNVHAAQTTTSKHEQTRRRCKGIAAFFLRNFSPRGAQSTYQTSRMPT